MLRILLTISDITAGKVTIDGFDVGTEYDDDSVRKRIGCVFAHPMLDPMMTVRENLEIRGCLYPRNLEDVEDVAEDAAYNLGISSLLDERYGNLSIESKKKADIARAIIGSPKILIMDEPTLNVDPGIRMSIWDIVSKLRTERRYTMIICTSVVAEAARCNEIIIMDHGRIVDKGTPVDLRNKYSSDRVIFIPKDIDELKGRLDGDGVKYHATRTTITIMIGNTMEAIPIVQKYESYLNEFEVVNGSLEEAFVEAISQKGGSR